MDLSLYAGKRFAVVLTDEKDESVAYLGWIAFEADQTLLLQRESGSLVLEPAWLGRIRAVDTENLQRILPDSDFWVSLRVGPPSEDGTTDIPTGMKWSE